MLRIVWANDQFGDHSLHEPTGLLGRGLSDTEDTFAEVRLGCYPAETAARSDSLGEGVQADDASLIVD